MFIQQQYLNTLLSDLRKMSPLPASELFHHFTVDLDSGPNALFGGGERVTGHVRIKLKKSTAIQVIRIQFKGRACLKDHKKGHDIEKIFFDKDFVLLERPPGNPVAGNFQWKADFDYSLPFEYILPMGCPSSFESPDAFVRYFARVTLQTCESQSPIYISKCHFSIYDFESTAAVEQQYEEPYVQRKTFKASGCCCCKRKVYLELIMPKRAFYANEILQSRLIIDNIADARIAQNIAYNVVERTAKAETPFTEVQKQPARVIKSGKVDVEKVEKKRNTIIINQLNFTTAPISASNSLATSTLPRGRSNPALSPDDSANKLFDHPSIISQTRKEPLFDIHYSLQILIGKFLIEVPFVLKPTGHAETKEAFASANESNAVKFIPSEVTEIKHSGSSRDIKDHFAEPDETDKLFVGSPDYTFVPLIPVYEKLPEDGNLYHWPELGTFGSNQKLIWHPDENEEKERKEKEVKELEKQKQKEAKVRAKKEKESKKKEKGDNKESEPLLNKDADEPGVSRIMVETTEFKSLEPSSNGNFVETETRFIETRKVKVLEQHGDSPSQRTEIVTVIEGRGQDAPVTTTYETTWNELVTTEKTPESQESEITIQKEELPGTEIGIEEVDNDKNNVNFQKLEDTSQKILERSDEVRENGGVHMTSNKKARDDVEQKDNIKKPLPQSNGEIERTKEVEESF